MKIILCHRSHLIYNTCVIVAKYITYSVHVCVSQSEKNHTHYTQVGCLYYITSHTLFHSEESASLNNCPIKVGLLVNSCMKGVSDTPGNSLPCKSSQSNSDSQVLVFGVSESLVWELLR